MPIRPRLARIVLAVLLALVVAQPALAESATPAAAKVVLTSPVAGSAIGGLVAINGTVTASAGSTYTLAFAPSRDSGNWIAIAGPTPTTEESDRLALWDTTRVPDGIYVLRLRLQSGEGGAGSAYTDHYVDGLLVSNSPLTPTPYPTALPTQTPTMTPLPTATPTLQPTPALREGESAYLYVTAATQHDPLCPEWQQRVAVWITNVGTDAVTGIVVTGELPAGASAVISRSSPEASLIGAGQVEWKIASLERGEGIKLELQIAVPDWALAGTSMSFRVLVTSDQVSGLSKEVTFLLSDCPWLDATLAALPLPTDAPTETATATATDTAGQAATRATVSGPTSTPVVVSIPAETVDRSLDVLTSVIIGLLAVLVVAMGVMLYRRLGPRR